MVLQQRLRFFAIRSDGHVGQRPDE